MAALALELRPAMIPPVDVETLPERAPLRCGPRSNKKRSA
jgi:hypothetical protein